MKIVIIDDNTIDLNKMKFRIEKYFPNINILGKFSDPRVGLEFIQKTPPDLLILDIEMPNMDGIKLLESLEFKSFETIFCTSHDKYALEAFKFFAIGFLYKPFSESEFIATMTTALSRMHSNFQKFSNKPPVHSLKQIAIPTQGCTYFTHFSDIIRIETINNYAKIYLVDGNMHLSSYGMRFYDEKLPEPDFFRPHKSHLVNVNYISKYFTDGTLVMKNGDKIPVARRRRNQLLDIFNNTSNLYI
ncbi:LytTR family DNA-binding domain-containing protein [Flavobacterium sp. NRK F10]|uniref:LytR/AlgR family response regulator transcription factor n=1 Tax=Flavobacterium sp. NRK F10 TaxID=2954931 RepID=UPI0020903B67|nr:LytTR family DNA-binding domain-containing protein [Flavobacterium sp. NRK F10]MCO6175391.1 LytTR family DNA-binding domain-containing protein [Flavobacterium sp. NRK F10]